MAIFQLLPRGDRSLTAVGHVPARPRQGRSEAWCKSSVLHHKSKHNSNSEREINLSHINNDNQPEVATKDRTAEQGEDDMSCIGAADIPEK
jgi:hypothetical protein